MQDTWLNHGIYTVLERIGSFQNFFTETASYLAAICFLMSIGMTCFKIWLSACDARQEITRLFLNFVFYTVMIWLYPVAMKGMLSFAMNMGYGAVFSGGSFTVESGSDRADFYEYMDEQTDGMFTTSESVGSDGQARVTLQMNLVDVKTGYIDINKSAKLIMAFARIFYYTTPDFALNKLGTFLMGLFLFVLVMVVVFVAYVTCLINFVMALLDYFALVGFGILMVPLSLWEGTKSYTATLISSFGKIFVKLLVISALMYLSFSVILDEMYQVYVQQQNNDAFTSIVKMLDMCIGIAIEAVFIFVMTKQTTAIAGFLSGGMPNLSFGEFVQGAQQAKGAVKASAIPASAGAKAAANVTSGLASSARAGLAGFSAARASGEGITGSIKSGMQSAAATEMKDLGKGIKNAMQNVPGAVDAFNGNMKEAFGFQGALSAEGLSLSGRRGYGMSAEAGVPLHGQTPSDYSPDANSEGISASSSSARGEGSSGPSDFSGSAVSGGAAASAAESEAAWKSGARGSYGSVSPEDNSSTGKMMRNANLNSMSENPVRRIQGHLQGAAANFSRGYSASRSRGDSPVQAFRSGLRQAPRGQLAAVDNFRGGAVQFKNGSTFMVKNTSAASDRYDSNGNYDRQGDFASSYEATRIQGNSDYMVPPEITSSEGKPSSEE